jgi:hypothetical protein
METNRKPNLHYIESNPKPKLKLTATTAAQKSVVSPHKAVYVVTG